MPLVNLAQLCVGPRNNGTHSLVVTLFCSTSKKEGKETNPTWEDSGFNINLN